MSILTISEKVRGDIGGKEFRAFEVTVASAQAALTVTAASCGMHHFDHVMAQGGVQATPSEGDWFLSTSSGPYIDINVLCADVGDKFELWAIGS